VTRWPQIRAGLIAIFFGLVDGLPAISRTRESAYACRFETIADRRLR